MVHVVQESLDNRQAYGPMKAWDIGQGSTPLALLMVDYKEGEVKDVEMHDGSHIRLRKAGHDYDPTNKIEALNMLRRCYDSGEFLTGLIYVNEQKPDFLTGLNMVDDALATLPQERTQPSPEDLKKIMEELM